MKAWNKLFAQKQTAKNNITNRLNVDLDELIALRFHAAGLDLSASFSRSKKAFSALSGGHLSPFKGRGLDFDEVRPYQPGDDIRNIDWNVTARTNKVHSKIFKEERERPVFIIADYRQNMHFATRGSLKSVQAARFAALTAWVAANDHNRVGGLIFTDDKQIEVRPKSGSKGVLKLLRLLGQNHSPKITMNSVENIKPNNQANHFDCHTLFQRLKKMIKPGSLIIFISDFNFINPENIHLLQYLSRHNDFMASFIYDPLEVELPPAGEYAVTTQRQTNITQNAFTTIDTSETKFRQEYRSQFIQRDAFLEQSFNQLGIHFNRFATNQDVVSVMSQFLAHNSAFRSKTARSSSARA